MLIQDLQDKKLIHPPKWLPDNCIYLTMMGSIAYNVSSDASDVDIYGICIPPKDDVFPHLKNEIPGFGRQIQRFEQFQEHHIQDGKKEYDISVYSIVKYFQLCMENNPNMIDSLFTPLNCVLHTTRIGNMIRENRKLFLHKGAKHKFLGYAFSQLSKIKNCSHEHLPEVIGIENRFNIPHGIKYSDVLRENVIFSAMSDIEFANYNSLYFKMITKSKRTEFIKTYGYDVKFAYHLVRLADELDQILTLGDIDLGRAAEHMKAVRRGEILEKDIYSWFSEKERGLEKLYIDSKLRHSAPEDEIKSLLLSCLEEHYGSLDKCIENASKDSITLRKIRELVL